MVDNVIGHFVKAELELTGYFGKVLKTMEGRIIYSTYQGSLIFLPKGKRNYGYKISEDDIKSVEIIRKDKAKHEEYLSLYKEREAIEKERQERLKREYEMREEERRQQKQEREAKLKAEIEEAKQAGNYEEIRQEVIDYYKSFKDDFYSEPFVESIVVPLIVKIVNKAISNVEEHYPKYYFDKKTNPKLCHLLEVKTGIKLTNTQKGNVQIINEYLTNSQSSAV